MYFIKRLFNPEIFQGIYKRKNYFEGWYYKLIDQQRQVVLAIIPGIAIGSSPKDAHTFIQVIDSIRGRVHHFKYPLDAFYADKNRFFDIVPFPKKMLAPGIMGPYSFVPWMECYHGIVNIHQKLKGNLNIAGDNISFDGGEGYVEKDWGRSFPEAWVWIQANHFDDKDTSFMFSIAKIPWFGSSFVGFIHWLPIIDQR